MYLHVSIVPLGYRGQPEAHPDPVPGLDHEVVLRPRLTGSDLGPTVPAGLPG
jgi:hypothetical protein